MDKEQLQLVALYNAAQNEYGILAHNLTHEQALAAVQGNAEAGAPMILEQRNKHKTENVGSCRTCREIVSRQPNLQPKPKFVKRFSAVVPVERISSSASETSEANND